MKGPALEDETRLWAKGKELVFGVDEAGRGCLAGPVYAALVAWKKGTSSETLAGIRDSKQLSEQKREEFFQTITIGAQSFGIGSASNLEIDQWNVLESTALAVARALEMALQKYLRKFPTLHEGQVAFLVDGKVSLLTRAMAFVRRPQFAQEFSLIRRVFTSPAYEECWVKGDNRSFSIAAGSILAKVSRDRRMYELDQDFPNYEFKSHKGYSTARHMELLDTFGPCGEHRKSFAPVRDLGLQLT